MSTQNAVYEAREHMLSEGTVPEQLARAVRPPVLQSWRRSIMSGAHVDSPALPFTGEHRTRAALRRAAEPVLERLAGQLAGMKAGVLLADYEANVLQRWAPDSTIRPMMDRINSDVGFSITEQNIGTNGVGSVLEFGGPIQISGVEHLAPALSAFTCVGVPIFHPVARRLEGVVTMNFCSTGGESLLTPLMTSVAQEVEHGLLAEATTVERQLLDEYLAAGGSRRAPIAAVGEDLFIAGPTATELVDGVDKALLWEHVRAVAMGSRADGSAHGLPTDRFRLTQCKPVTRDGAVIGAIVALEATEPTAGGSAEGPRSEVSLPGKSAALVQAVSHATRLAASRTPMLVEGEPGVGKFALARAVCEAAVLDRGSTAIVDAAVSGAEDAGGFVTVLRHELELAPAVLVLRHLEALPQESAAAAASILEEQQRSDGAPWLVATRSTGEEEPNSGQRRLIDTLGAGRVALPPLRDRREDIAPVAADMLRQHAGSRRLRFSSPALRCLVRAPWAGNLRQLEATIRGAIATTISTEVRPEALPTELQGTSQKRALSAMEELELNAILDALRKHGGNKVAAAQSLGIARSTLYRKLHVYHIDPDRQYF